MQKQILVELPKEESFNVPEGIHKVVAKDVLVLNQPFKELSEKTVRIKWHIPGLNKPGVEYVVAKNYPLGLEPHSELRKDLSSWLGDDGFQALGSNGSVDLGRLIGMEAEIYTKHGPDRGFKHPFVNVTNVVPVGTYTHGLRTTPAPCMKSIAELLKQKP